MIRKINPGQLGKGTVFQAELIAVERLSSVVSWIDSWGAVWKNQGRQEVSRIRSMGRGSQIAQSFVRQNTEFGFYYYKIIRSLIREKREHLGGYYINPDERFWHFVLKWKV